MQRLNFIFGERNESRKIRQPCREYVLLKKRDLRKDLGLKCRRHRSIFKTTSENDQEIPQSRIADQPVVIPLWLFFV